MTENPGLRALVVRNIGDLEAAWTEVEAMDAALWSELNELVLHHPVTSDWRVADKFDRENNYFLPKEWVDGIDGEADEWAWLSFEPSTPQGEEDWSSLSMFTQSGPRGCSMEIAIVTDKSVGKARKKSILAANPDIIKGLGEHDLEYDPNEASVYLTVRIDPELLAKAFEDGDFATALQPIAMALDKIQAARSDLDHLVKALRQ